jgi:hypothetical protein
VAQLPHLNCARPTCRPNRTGSDAKTLPAQHAVFSARPPQSVQGTRQRRSRLLLGTVQQPTCLGAASGTTQRTEGEPLPSSPPSIWYSLYMVKVIPRSTWRCPRDTERVWPGGDLPGNGPRPLCNRRRRHRRDARSPGRTRTAGTPRRRRYVRGAESDATGKHARNLAAN